MPSGHDHPHARRAVAAEPTLSLLRLSAAQRLAGAAAVIATLWLLIYATLA